MMNIQLQTIYVYFVNMEFGHVYDNLEPIDFSLPPDTEKSIKSLQANTNKDNLMVYVGGTKWAVKSWLGKIYPVKTPESEFPREYSKNFNTIEFGPTFYNIYQQEKIAKWKESAEDSPGFKFCPRFFQGISHIRRLVNVDDLTLKYYQSLNAFGNQLGPVLLQFGDNFTPKSFPTLKAYLESLPPSIKVAVEVRNKNWFASDGDRMYLFDLLNRLNIIWVISDTPGRRDCVHMELTSPDAFIRFVGNNLDKTDYSRIDEWVERLNVWKAHGLRSIWFFMHQFDESTVPDSCDYLINQLNIKLGTQIKRPNII